MPPMGGGRGGGGASGAPAAPAPPSGPQLGGLFAGGMPKLKKTGAEGASTMLPSESRILNDVREGFRG